MPPFSKNFKPLPGLHVVRRLPVEMVAGSTYEWQIRFVNHKSESGYANITLQITEEKTLIGLGEFTLEGTLEAYDNPPRKHTYTQLTFKETQGGTFQALQTPIEKRFNDVTLRISSVPNLMPGTYTFTLNIWVASTPKLSVTISPSSATLDVGQSQRFTSTVTDGTSPYSYQWYLSGAPVSGATKPTWKFTPTSAGSYTVYVKVNDSAGMQATSNTATVKVNAALSVTISPNSVTLDVGQSQLFTSSVTGGTPPYMYRWYLNDHTVSSDRNPIWIFTPTSAGSYTVYVKVTDSLGMQATSNTATVTVKKHK